MPQVGKPGTIKLINLSVIREMFMRGKSLTCAEISYETGISITTVRAIVNEMLDKGELTSRGLGESSGGRKSEQFIINNNCYYGISICVTDSTVFASIVNIHSEILETQAIPIGKDQNLCDTLIELLRVRVNNKTRALGIGVPGVVSPVGYIRKAGGELIDNVDILTPLKQRFALPVTAENDRSVNSAVKNNLKTVPAAEDALRTLPIILENDLGASTLGFSDETENDSAVAFINFENSCNEISAGFVADGRILHGTGNFSGELGLIPYDGERNFGEALYDAANDKDRTEIIAKLTALVCCVINPRQIMLCGDSGFRINRCAVENYLSERLPIKMIPKISVSSDFRQYFLRGMAVLTSKLIFSGHETAGFERV